MAAPPSADATANANANANTAGPDAGADAGAGDAAAADTGLSPSGFRPVDMTYYDLLGVPASASALDIKKAYRKQAIRHHPDKGGDEQLFVQIGEAYRILSSPDDRASYDHYGPKSSSSPHGPDGEVGLKEATEMFGSLFGGERFVDLIGEISLLKDMGKASEIMMSDEEREQLEKEMKEAQEKERKEREEQARSAALKAGVPLAAEKKEEKKKDEVEEKPAAEAAEAASDAAAAPAAAAAAEDHVAASASASASTGDVSASASANDKEKEKDKKRAAKLTPEQRQKLEQLEREKEAAQEKRIADLTEKLISRIRPFVEAKHPGEADDPETIKFEKRMREEAEDLKLESFGVELLHAIGSVYVTKASVWIKTHKNNFLGLPGFLSKMREKGSVMKEGWGLLGSAVSAQISMEDMAKRQERGDLGEEEMRELEMEMSGKMLLVTWRGTKWEVSSVLRKVCERVLNDKSVKDKKVLLNRARALVFLGSIYQQVKPDESDDERRELEKLVANAAASKKKSKDKKQHKDSKGAAKSADGSPVVKPADAKPREEPTTAA